MPPPSPPPRSTNQLQCRRQRRRDDDDDDDDVAVDMGRCLSIRGRNLITADLEQRLPQITQSLLQVLLSPPPPARLRRRWVSSGFPPSRILARPVLQSRRQPRSPLHRRQRRRCRWRRRGRRTLRRNVIAGQSDEAGRGPERRQGRLPFFALHEPDRLVHRYDNGRGRLVLEIRFEVINDFFFLNHVLRLECGLVEREGHWLASVGEDEFLYVRGTALDLDWVLSQLAGSFGVFRVSPLGPLAVEVKASEGGFI